MLMKCAWSINMSSVTIANYLFLTSIIWMTMSVKLLLAPVSHQRGRWLLRCQPQGISVNIATKHLHRLRTTIFISWPATMFILYTAGLINLIEGYCLKFHLYADDTQIKDSCRPGLPTSSSPPCQLAWTKCLAGCSRIVYSWTLQNQKSSGVRPLIGRTICHLLLFASERTTCCPRQPWSSHRQQCYYAVPCVAYGVRMFRCVTTASQHQTLSVRFCVPFAGRVAGYAMSRLLQCNTRRTSCVSAQSTSVGSQCCLQTDTSIFSVWARHTNAARPTLAAVSRTHRFQVSCAHLPMPAWLVATVSFWLHPEHRRFQPSLSPVVVIIAASYPTYTAVHCWWSCISGCRMQPLEQSVARHHLSFNTVCFSKPLQNSSLFPSISFLFFGF